MPTLDWIGYMKVINHHLHIPYRVLEHQYTFNHIGTSTSSVSDSATVVEPVETNALRQAQTSFPPEY
jgi:adenine-specific DNA-methyltransferase